MFLVCVHLLASQLVHHNIYFLLFLVRDFAIGKQLFIVSGKLTAGQILSSSHLIHCFSVFPFQHLYNNYYSSEGF